MTSWNERVPLPSNRRLFHVPMLIPRESFLAASFFLPRPIRATSILLAPPPPLPLPRSRRDNARGAGRLLAKFYRDVYRAARDLLSWAHVSVSPTAEPSQDSAHLRLDAAFSTFSRSRRKVSVKSASNSLYI